MINLFVPIFGDIKPGYLLRNYDPSKKGADFAFFISNMIDLALVIAGLLFFAFLVTGGIKYLTSGGDIKQTQEASKQITSAIIGLSIVAGAFALTRIIGTVLGIDIFRPIFKGP